MYSSLKIAVLLAVYGLFLAPHAQAITPRKIAKAQLATVCPTVLQFDAVKHFYKNNKPIRDGSYLTAPVIGYNRVMTFGYNAGKRGPLLGSTTMYDKAGNAIAAMTSFPCRSDHCGGRNVSSTATATARRRAMRSTGSPNGFVKLSRRLCVKMVDIGKCYGNEVNKNRGPCAGTVS